MTRKFLMIALPGLCLGLACFWYFSEANPMAAVWMLITGALFFGIALES